MNFQKKYLVVVYFKLKKKFFNWFVGIPANKHLNESRRDSSSLETTIPYGWVQFPIESISYATSPSSQARLIKRIPYQTVVAPLQTMQIRFRVTMLFADDCKIQKDSATSSSSSSNFQIHKSRVSNTRATAFDSNCCSMPTLLWQEHLGSWSVCLAISPAQSWGNHLKRHRRYRETAAAAAGWKLALAVIVTSINRVDRRVGAENKLVLQV